MPVPPPIRSVQDILNELNAGKSAPVWVELQGYYALKACKIEKKEIHYGPNAAALKAFFNAQTGEIKLYLAKALSIPERDDLWQ